MAAAETPPLIRRLLRIVEHPVFRVAVPILIAMIAIFVLHKLVSQVRWVDVKADLAAASGTTLLKALVCTLFSFAGIACYDALAVRSAAPGKVPIAIAALTGAAGYAISGLLGISYLTGTAVRFRVYSAFDLDLVQFAGVIAISWSGFLAGLLAVLGGLLACNPNGLSTMLPIAPRVAEGVGSLVLFLMAASLVWLATGSRRLKAGAFRISLPDAATGIALTCAGVVDLTGAAATLHVLMPADAVQNLPYFAALFFAAAGLGLISHSPGGLGVFEATIIAGLGAAGRSDVLAALLLYRMIYTILPFLIAVAGLGGNLAWRAGGS
ncbi:hypothetical protein [Pseudorhodobacter sp.]|uniref:hypothetical protein n=1 Tax=Pseudorhodobacter sp. TaxID=1934400 RepID=UPI002649CD55|nr:hypothetical protein [Pseudorhodobacter sp.]MDN5785854.1 hypothetical protein [Pseudorhodobacter sp.]